MLNSRKTEKSYVILGGLFVIRQSIMAVILLVILTILLFLERYFFMILIYKTKCTNYILLFFITFINAFILCCQKVQMEGKVQQKMHKLFLIEDVKSPPILAVIIFGCLDMAYAFTLFWPANTLPLVALVNIMQLYVPLETFINFICCCRKEYKKHLFFSLLILAGGVFSYFSVVNNFVANPESFGTNDMRFYLQLAIVSQVFNVLSHSGKEKMVRGYVLNQTTF